MNINTKMNLKALHDLQRMAWLKTGAKICSGISILKRMIHQAKTLPDV